MPRWNTVAIVGVGLIGGSVGLALRKKKLAKNVVGIGRRAASLRAARDVGAVTATTTRLEQGVRKAELIVVCSPVELVAEHVIRAAQACPEGALITDAASTKAQIVAQVEASAAGGSWRPGARFVGSHPMAGSEKNGPRHAAADLFRDRPVLLTPTGDTSPRDRALVAEFWQSLGARTVVLSPAEHDCAVAAISHLPHLVAAAIAAATPKQYVSLSAGGWLDTTRVAAGDPGLWRQILLSNRQQALAALERFEGVLAQLRSALAAGDSAALESLLIEAKRVRNAVGN